MKAELFMIMAAATMILAGCSNDENEPVDNWNGEIRLTSGVTLQTRANTQAEQILNDEVVFVWADKATEPTATEYINAWLLTAKGSGNFTGSSQYYPTDGSKLDFYALHGHFDSMTQPSVFPMTLIHVVKDNQSDTNMQEYAHSDLLYAVKKGVERSSNAVELTFYHMLSKVEVALKAGDGNPDLTGATVTIEGTKTKADFTPDKSATMTNQSDRANMVKLTTSDVNNAISIKIKTVTTTNFNSNSDYGEAVVVPQTITKGTAFIKVKLSNDAVFSYKIPDSSGLTLESGKKYTYKITVNQSGLTVTSEIEPWKAVNAVEGNAVMD